MSVAELKARIDRGDAPLLIDVRESYEHAICRIPGAVLIPLAHLGERIPGIDPSREIVVHCRSGLRSAHAVGMLQARGFSRVRNLAGGILAWIADVDPAQPKY